MAITTESEAIKNTLLRVAEQMLVAARTAPKGKGISALECCIVTGDDIERIASKMDELGNLRDQPSMLRDAGNIRKAPVVVLLATRIAPIGLKVCGLCGFANCEEKKQYPQTPCVFNTGDLGIAIGSAVSVAADNRVDNRIMYTVGLAVKEMDILPGDVAIVYAIPLSASSKNPFFDR